MGAFLDSPKTEKCNEHGAGNNLRYGVASMQGWRFEMEDAHRVIPRLNGELGDWSYFAVFDGHAGALVSAHSSENLFECIMQTEKFEENVIEGIHSGFLRLDNNMRDLPEMTAGTDKSGSTAVCAFISPRNIYIANCGDSRAVLCNSGRPIFSTRDHKPAEPAEKERIQRAGGSVMVQRVNGSLAVSRALGDYEYKNVEGRGPCEQLVSPEPEIFVRDRDESDEFLVLACDGIWDVMNNKELCDYIHSRLLLTDDLEAVTNQVVDTCLYKGSRDNMSIILVTFPGAPTPSPEAQRREAELENTIKRKIKEIVAQHEGEEELSYSQVVQLLRQQDIPNLPPGAGLFGIQPMIQKVFLELCPSRAKNVKDGMLINDGLRLVRYWKHQMRRRQHRDMERYWDSRNLQTSSSAFIHRTFYEQRVRKRATFLEFLNRRPSTFANYDVRPIPRNLPDAFESSATSNLCSHSPELSTPMSDIHHRGFPLGSSASVNSTSVSGLSSELVSNSLSSEFQGIHQISESNSQPFRNTMFSPSPMSSALSSSAGILPFSSPLLSTSCRTPVFHPHFQFPDRFDLSTGVAAQQLEMDRGATSELQERDSVSQCRFSGQEQE